MGIVLSLVYTVCFRIPGNMAGSCAKRRAIKRRDNPVIRDCAKIKGFRGRLVKKRKQWRRDGTRWENGPETAESFIWKI